MYAEGAKSIDRARQSYLPSSMSRVPARRVIVAIAGFAARAGVPPPVLLQAARLDPKLLTGPDSYLLHVQEMRLWDEAARLTGDHDLGLHMAEWVALCPEDHFDVLAFAARSCATLGDHYRRVARYIRLAHGGVQLSLEEDADVVRLVHSHHQQPSAPRHPVECMMALALLQGRTAIGEELRPQYVCFAHARPEQTQESARIFAAPVHYGCPRNELVLDRALIERPQHQAEPRLLAMLLRQLEGDLAERPENHSFRDEVMRCMMDELPDREPAMAAIAAKLHMSPRSLHRRLKIEDTSFAEVFSALRRDLALRYLQDPRISIGEAGFLLGFSDVSAFHRAFKRWTGNTPAAYQNAARTGRSPLE